MAYWIHEAGNRNTSLYRFFMCDYLSDIQNLPDAQKDGQPQPNDTVCKNKCSPGSKCFCQEDGSVWLLGKETNKWKKMKSASSGSTGGSTIVDENIEPIPFSSIQSLFP